MTLAHDEAVIEAAAVDAIFAEARTANAFTGDVTDEQARAIYELTKFGPTAFNSQPLRVTYVRSDEARATLVDALAAGNRAKTASAPLVAVLSYDTAWQDQWDTFLPGYNAPKAMYDAAPELAAATGNNNAHLQAGYFILAVRTLGLAAGPMTGADFAKIDAAFFPDGSQKSFLVVNIGQPGQTPGAKPSRNSPTRTSSAPSNGPRRRSPALSSAEVPPALSSRGGASGTMGDRPEALGMRFCGSAQGPHPGPLPILVRAVAAGTVSLRRPPGPGGAAAWHTFPCGT